MPIFRRTLPSNASPIPELSEPKSFAETASSNEASALLQIYAIITSDDFDQAYDWLRTQFGVNTWEDVKQKCPRGSTQLRYLQRVYLFVETVGDLLQRDLRPEAPVFELIDEIGINAWETIVPWVADARRELKNPRLYANIEWLAARFFDWQREPSRRA